MNSMAQKHLHELLKEDQEPFLLQNYIADKRCQLRSASQKSSLQVKKRRPINQVSNFPGNLCKNACFFSIQDSPDLRKSPLFDFSSPAAAKSPCKSPNAIFLHIPNRTAALLVEAAMRIQKNSTPSTSSKAQTQNRNHGFGLFGSFLKRLTNRNRTRKRGVEGDEVKVSVKDLIRWDSSVKYSHEKPHRVRTEEKVEACLGAAEKSASEISTACEMCFSASSSSGSVDMDSASSSSQHSEESADTNCACSCEKINSSFCESPFRFVLQTTPSPSGGRTPEFTSPAASPSRHKQEEEGLKKFQVEEEEEDKEQCSPVSVLDPPFQDDDDDEGRDDGEDEDGYDMECSYANVQRTKQNLLQKLRRFEKLAGLDPIELEKRMLEEDDDDDGDDEYSNIDDLEGESEECEDEDSKTSDIDAFIRDAFIREVLSKLNFHCTKRIPKDLKRLVSDLIVEEQSEEDDDLDAREEVVRRVCKRFESWKEVQSNTIDMMVEQDFRKELDGWKKNQDQMGEAAMEIELSIFSLLVEEMAMELV